jgi:hypothetical protein
LFEAAPLTKIRRMNLKAALLATAAGAFLLVAACGGGGSGSDSNGSTGGGSGSSGGGGGGSSSSSSSGSSSSGSSSSGSSSSGTGSSSSSSSGTGSSGSCHPLTPTTFVGGNLFVAEQGPVGVTLLSDGGLSPLIFANVYFGSGFMILYDNVFGMQVSNRQDKFGFAKPFAPGTQVGASTQVQLQPPPADVIRNYGPVPSTFPKGIPLELWLKTTDGNPTGPANSSGTARIGKDTALYSFPTASVTYGPNNTATVTFFASSDGPHFSVGLTNVFGTGCP